MIITPATNNIQPTQAAETSPSKTENNSETTIQYQNDYYSMTDAIVDKLREHYGSVAEENNRICRNKEELRYYIWEKYHVTTSPKYVGKGLTAMERHACYRNEVSVSLGSKSFDTRDPLFCNDAYYYDVDVAKRNQYNRMKVNSQISDLFAQNGISVPKGVRLRFSIEPNDYRLTVSGTDDMDLKQRIEAVLNKKENSKNLFLHILNVQDDRSSQITVEKRRKYHLNNTIKTNTGYHLHELTIRDNKLYTPEGKEVLSLLMSGLDLDHLPPECRGALRESYRQSLEYYAKNPNRVEDMVLSIDYQDGSLYDVGQARQYGTGQTDWIDEMVHDARDRTPSLSFRA